MPDVNRSDDQPSPTVAEPQPPAAEAAEGNEDPMATPRPRPSLRRGLIVMGLAVLAAATARYFAPQFDYQNANLIGLACLLAGLAYLLFSLHRRSRWAGHPWRVPAAILGVLLATLGLFRFDGFSGEMLPQFQLRFADPRPHELKTLADRGATAAAPANAAADAPQTSPEARSPQFLGPNRNGVHGERHFRVPQTEQEATVLWDQGIGAAWSSFAVADGQAITLEQRDGHECLTCYRLDDGELLWINKHAGRHENPLGGVGPRSTPTIVGERVYATTATGFLWCVDRKSGTPQWTRNLLELAGWDQDGFEQAAPWGYACSPLLVDGLCVVTLGGPDGRESPASLAALDADTGDVVWRSGQDQLSYASPVLATLDGMQQIVSVNEDSVSGHAIADGELLWTFDWPGSTNTGATCSSAMPVGSHRLLMGKGYGGGSKLMSLTRDEGDWQVVEIWRSSRVLKTKFNHTCVQGEIGYGISNGMLQAVDLQDAQRLWMQPRSSRAAQGHVILVGDILVVQDEGGDVVFVEANPEEYIERFRLPALNAKTWNIPTVAGRYLLVRNDRQAICFELPRR